MIFPILRSPKAPETCTIGFHGRYIVTETAVVGSPVWPLAVSRCKGGCEIATYKGSGDSEAGPGGSALA